MDAVAVGLACCAGLALALWWRAASALRPRGAARASLVGRPAPGVEGGSWGDGTTVLAFLTSGCSTCRPLWGPLAAGERPAGAEVVVVTPDAGGEDRRQVSGLAGDGVAVVMSTQAWLAYAAAGAPWVAVVRAGVVVAEGRPDGWAALERLVRSAG